jgi:hypothetical protein
MIAWLMSLDAMVKYTDITTSALPDTAGTRMCHDCMAQGLFTVS